MATRLLRCAIEKVADGHPHLYVEPCVVAFVAVAGQYSPSPALFEVECGNIASRRLGQSAKCRLSQVGDPVPIEHPGGVIRQLVLLADGRVSEEEVR